MPALMFDIFVSTDFWFSWKCSSVLSARKQTIPSLKAELVCNSPKKRINYSEQYLAHQDSSLLLIGTGSELHQTLIYLAAFVSACKARQIFGVKSLTCTLQLELFFSNPAPDLRVSNLQFALVYFNNAHLSRKIVILLQLSNKFKNKLNKLALQLLSLPFQFVSA